MLNSIFKPTVVYIKVFETKVEVRRCDGSALVSSSSGHKPFSSSRSLIGSFNIAENIIRESIQKIVEKRMITPRISGLIQGKDKSEGGYTEVEERVLRELAYGAGCSSVIVWYGEDLSDEDVNRKIKNI